MMSRPAGLLPLEPIACGDCALGRLSRAGEGQFCPLIIRRYRPGSLLCRAGDPASYVWMRQSDERVAAVWRALLDDPLPINR